MLDRRIMLLNLDQKDAEKYFTPISNYIAVKYGITFLQNNLESLVNNIANYMIENYGYDIDEWELLSLEDDVEDLFWFVEKYKEYYKKHNGKRYLDPAGLHYAIQTLIIKKGYFIDD